MRSATQRKHNSNARIHRAHKNRRARRDENLKRKKIKRRRRRRRLHRDREISEAINITKDKNNSLHYFMRWKINCRTPGWVSRSWWWCCCRRCRRSIVGYSWTRDILIFCIFYLVRWEYLCVCICVSVSALFGNSLSCADIVVVFFLLRRCRTHTISVEEYTGWSFVLLLVADVMDFMERKNSTKSNSAHVLHACHWLAICICIQLKL